MGFWSVSMGVVLYDCQVSSWQGEDRLHLILIVPKLYCLFVMVSLLCLILSIKLLPSLDWKVTCKPPISITNAQALKHPDRMCQVRSKQIGKKNRRHFRSWCLRKTWKSSILLMLASGLFYAFLFAASQACTWLSFRQWCKFHKVLQETSSGYRDCGLHDHEQRI